MIKTLEGSSIRKSAVDSADDNEITAPASERRDTQLNSAAQFCGILKLNLSHSFLRKKPLQSCGLLRGSLPL